MTNYVQIDLTELLFSVSEAMDLVSPTLTDHQLRTAYATHCLAKAAKLPPEESDRLHIASLLHDIGALSPDERIDLHAAENAVPDAHCHRGATLFRDAFWLEPSANIVAWHHTPITEHSQLGRNISDPDVLGAQILYLCEHLERAVRRDTFILHQHESLIRSMQQMAGKEVHSDVVDLFCSASKTEGFWLPLVSKDLAQTMKARPQLRHLDSDMKTIRSVASVFKNLVDFRSRFTATHSAGVACCAKGIAKTMHFSTIAQKKIELAGLLHDIGKLVVPNSIIHNPGRLTPSEYAVMRQHPYFTFSILSKVQGMESIAEWAGSHHERLDGSGYNFGSRQDTMDLETNILAVADVATAVAERRPYRDAQNENVVLGLLRNMEDKNLLDSFVVEALADNYDDIMHEVASAQSADEEHYTRCYAGYMN